MEPKTKTKGLAPFASVEDLSDEQDSPGHDKHRLALPGIKEDSGIKSPRSGPAAITPRIDISRASSSSHHDDSSPERDLFAGPGATAGGTKLGLGFSEEMALELRSSTEELDFQDPADNEIKMKRKKLHQQHAVTKCELETQSERETKERKDSACSDIGLLSISGRTSRLSSIGSAASGGSGASHISGNSHLSGGSHLSGVSHLSGASHLSGVSHISGVSHLSQLSKASRCSSPHRMLLETSFCGQKPIPTVSLEAEYPPEECVEAALLARKSDPTGAVLPPEGSKPFVNGNRRLSSSTSTLTVKKSSSRIDNKSKSSSDCLSRTHSGKSTNSVPVPSRTKRHSSHKVKLNEFEQIIPLHGDDDDVIEDEKSTETKTEHKISPENGIYIPLKGPDINYSKSTKHDNIKFDNQIKSKTNKTRTKTKTNQVKNVKDEELVKFISLHADESKRKPLPIQTKQDEACLLTKSDMKIEKVVSSNQLDVQPVVPNVPTIQSEYFKPDELTRDPSYIRKHSAGSCRSPEFEVAKVKPATLDLTGIVRPSRPAQSLTQLARDESRTPSPAASFSRGSVFRRSSESSSSSKSRVSGSSESKNRKDSRSKTSFTNLFKKGSKERSSGRKKSETSEKSFTGDSRLTNIEIDYNHEDKIQDGNCIVIPLHSPDSVGEPILLAADMEPDSFIDIHLVKTPSKSLSLKSQDLTPASVIEVAAATAQYVEPVEDVKPNTSTDLSTTSTEEKLVTSVKEERESEAEVHPVEVNLKAEVDVQSKLEVDIKEKSEIIVNNTKTELDVPADILESDKKSDSEKKAGSEERRSSGSEPDSDAVPLPNGEDDEHERKGLVHQAESVEDELPYVPTTLPQERSVAHPIVPIKQRVSEVKTFPIDRPRSTTPINPATLDDYVSSPHEEIATTKDKMQIILPRTGSISRETKSKSPCKVKPWTHFAEQGLQSPRELRRTASPSPPTVAPPPLPPRVSTSWVCFDELPERRRTPKRITTLPAPPNPQTTASNIVYSYVNPEECSCECHETQGRVNGAQCSEKAGQCNSSDKDRSSYRT